jgi:hypothetical protein
LHASAKCFQRGSIVSFDAKDVTLFLSPVLDPTCAADAEPGPGIKQLAATISGELVFPGFQEFEVGTWDIVPKPKDKEIRVAYVYTTQATLDSRNPEPDSAGAELARVTEDTAIAGTRGYLYRIAARAGGLAVYALAGLERLDTHEFTPYVMGIAHNVVTSPGDENKGVDLSMTITLDRELDIGLAGVPAATPDGPTEYRVRAYADLGGEGLIVRTVNGVSLDVMIRHTGTEPFRFLGQPAFVGGLSDASYYVLAGFYTTDVDVPFTSQKRNGVLQSAQPLRFTDFLGIPLATSPELGATIPSDRTLRFKLDGPSPDLIMVDIAGGDGQVAWTEILPGTAREAPIPDLSSIPGQSDITPGFIQWMVTAVKIDQFRYNEFQYTYLSNRYWTHTSRNVFFARR